MINLKTKKYKRNSKIIAAQSVVRRSIRLLTIKRHTTAVSTHQGKYHHKCIQIDQNKNMFETKYNKLKTPNKLTNCQTPVKFINNKKFNEPKTPQTLPSKLYNLRKHVNSNTNTPIVKQAPSISLTKTPVNTKQTQSRLKEKNSKTINVLTKTPISIAKTRLQIQQEQQSKTPVKHLNSAYKEHTRHISHSLKKIESEKIIKTPASSNKIVHRKLFATEIKGQTSNSTSKVASDLKTRIAGGARRSLGFIKKACSSSTSSLNKLGNSRIPRPVSKIQTSNLVINKVKTEIELFEKVAEILDKTENVANEDKIVELPIQALKMLYETPNRDKIIKTIKRVSIIENQVTTSTTTSDDINELKKQETSQSNIEIVAKIQEFNKLLNEKSDNEEKIELNCSIDDENNVEDDIEADNKNNNNNNENGIEDELNKQNQIEVFENEILINDTPIHIKENEKKILKLMEQKEQQRKSSLKRTSEIISPFAMNNMFKKHHQGPKTNEVLTPNGLKRVFKSDKQKQMENLSPFAMKNLFKKHKENEENINLSPFAMKNLFKRHQQNIENGNLTTSPFTMKNLFKLHQQNKENDIKASPFSMKNLFKQHFKDAKLNNEGIAASPYAMKNLFKQHHVNYTSENIDASPFAMRNLFKLHQKQKENEIAASPHAMKNLFKTNNGEAIGVNNENLSPVALKSLFRNKILKKQHLMESQATPLSMKNLFKITNKNQIGQNLNAILSPTVMNCMFNENRSSPVKFKVNDLEEPKTPNDKLEIICDKIINNETDVKNVQNELECIESTVLLNHIIDLKQQVKALEDFNEQLINSINESIDEIVDDNIEDDDDDVEPMSIQYADVENFDVEEVILSVNCITSEPEGINNENFIATSTQNIDNEIETEDNEVDSELLEEDEVIVMSKTTQVDVKENEVVLNENENIVVKEGVNEAENNEESLTTELIHEDEVVVMNKTTQVDEKESEVVEVETESVIKETSIIDEEIKIEQVESQNGNVVINVEIVSEPVIAESIVKAQEIVEIINEAIVNVDDDIQEKILDKITANDAEIMSKVEIETQIEEQNKTADEEKILKEPIINLEREDLNNEKNVIELNKTEESINSDSNKNERIENNFVEDNNSQVEDHHNKDSENFHSEMADQQEQETKCLMENEKKQEKKTKRGAKGKSKTDESLEEKTDDIKENLDNFLESAVAEYETPLKSKRGRKRVIKKQLEQETTEETNSQENICKDQDDNIVVNKEVEEEIEVNTQKLKEDIEMSSLQDEVKKPRGRRGKKILNEIEPEQSKSIVEIESIDSKKRVGTRGKKAEIIIDEQKFEENVEILEKQKKTKQRNTRAKKINEEIESEEKISEIILAENCEVVHEDIQTTQENSVDLEVKKPRRGGRPKKNSSEINEIKQKVEDEIVAPVEIKLTRKGGRRKAQASDNNNDDNIEKVISSNTNQLSELLKIENENNEEIVETQNKKANKRSKKNLTDVVEQEEVIEEPKKRNRKAPTRGKAKEEEEVNNEVEETVEIETESKSKEGRITRKKKEQLNECDSVYEIAVEENIEKPKTTRSRQKAQNKVDEDTQAVDVVTTTRNSRKKNVIENIEEEEVPKSQSKRNARTKNQTPVETETDIEEQETEKIKTSKSKSTTTKRKNSGESLKNEEQTNNRRAAATTRSNNKKLKV